MSEQEAAAFWEQRYGEREHIWSGQPNDALVAVVSGLRPGRALDLGCGEGADTLYLAEQGWEVTGVDISTTAVVRATKRAAAGGARAGSVTWVVGDLGSWEPAGPYELVSACFLHSPVELPRAAVLRRAASAVVEGGHLLVVGHAAFPPWAEPHDEHHRFLSPEEEIEELRLPPADWETALAETRSREAVGPDGTRATLEDAVVLLRRR